MDSLNILIADSPSPNQPQSGKSNAVQHLEKLTKRLLELASRHEWEHPDFQTFLALDYTAYLEYTDHPISTSREEFLANYKTFTDANPEYTFEPISVSVDVDEKNGYATVWMHLRVKGHPSTVWRESVTVIYWRREEGKWFCYKQNGIRGVGWDL